MKKPTLQRSLEVLPGALTWTALLLPFIGAFIYPLGVAIFILIFDLYWIYKAVLMAWHLITGYRNLTRDQKINWLSKLTKDDKKIYQAIILTTYKEPVEVLEQSIQSIADSAYPSQRQIFVLATEGRDSVSARAIAKAIRAKYQAKFAHFLVTEHPDNIPGEMKAKGANLDWAARKLSEYIKNQKIDPDNVIITAADADTRFHKQYFAAVAHNFVNNPNRHRRFYQPIPIFANNIWQAHPISRILAFGSTYWQLIESTRPWRLITFSTHSASLKMLKEMDYWDVTIVNEDSRQFWRGYFAFDGNCQVEPVFIPVYMDAVQVPSFTRTVKNQYLQRLRWAYGIEHFPYIIQESLKNTKIALRDRIVKVYRFSEANFSWATASLFIAFVGWIPILLNRQFSQTVIAYNLPIITSRLLAVSWIGLAISAWLSLRLAPPLPPDMKKQKKWWMVFQWIIVPIPAIFFGSIPAIEAQTRLMFGKYLGFWTTEKAREGDK